MSQQLTPTETGRYDERIETPAQYVSAVKDASQVRATCINNILCLLLAASSNETVDIHPTSDNFTFTLGYNVVTWILI
jgi:hypothetical protein